MAPPRRALAMARSRRRPTSSARRSPSAGSELRPSTTRRIRALAGAATCALVLAVALLRPAPAPAADPCSFAPSGPTKALCHGAGQVAKKVAHGDPVGAAKSVPGAALDTACDATPAPGVAHGLCKAAGNAAADAAKTI